MSEPKTLEDLIALREQINERMEWHPEDRTYANYRRRDQLDQRIRKLRGEDEE